MPTNCRPHKFPCPQVATQLAFPTPVLSPLLCVRPPPRLRRWVQPGPAEMEWKLEKSVVRRTRTDEDLLWEKMMRTLGKDLKRSREQSLQKMTEVKAGTDLRSSLCVLR